MLKGLWRNKRWPIGLDVGSDCVRLLQLERVGGGLAVTACSESRLPRGVTGTDKRKAVVAGIREALSSQPFHGRRVVSALSSADLAMKNIRVPVMSEKELADAIRWEASERFAFPVSPDRLHWLKAGQVRQGNETREEVIMLAVPAEAVDEHLSLLSEVGLIPESIEAEPVALFRVFQHLLRRRADEESVSMVADIGRSGTRIAVARGQTIIFAKKIDIGGEQFSAAVAKQLNLTPDEAYDLRVRTMRENAGWQERNAAEKPAKPEDRSSVEWTIRDAMRAEAEALAHEIALCLRYCSVTFRGLRAQCLLLTGGEAYDSALVNMISENLGIECQVGRPLRGVDVSRMQVESDRRGTLAEWTVCAGLALKRADLQEDDQGHHAEPEHVEHRLSA